MRFTPGLPLTPLSVTLTDVCGGVDLTSSSIKCNLNILYGTIGDAVGLFQNITNATLITLDSTMSCRPKYNLA